MTKAPSPSSSAACRSLLSISSHNRNTGALIDKTPSGGKTYSAVSAGDQSYFVLQPHETSFLCAQRTCLRSYKDLMPRKYPQREIEE